MRKKWYSLLMLCFLYSSLSAQTLVTIGDKQISLQTFEKAYQENIDLGQSFESKKEFFETFLNYELKVAEALSQELDRSFVINNELNSFKEHLLHRYRYDLTTFKSLVQEAKERSSIDLNLSYIVIPVDYKNITAAEEKINNAFKALQGGTDFGEVAIRYSEDSSVQQNKGFVGNISAFTLPYKIENQVYALTDGKYTTPFRHGNKWYIFKRNASAPSKGKIQIQQLILYYPGQVNQKNRDSLWKLAGDIRNKIVNGLEFDEAVTQYHADPRAAQSKGILSPFGVGEYDTTFENAAFQLTEEGQISLPFETSFGVHLLKLIKKLPTSSFSDDYWEQRVETNDRIGKAFEALNQKIEQKLKLTVIDSVQLLAVLKDLQRQYQTSVFKADTTTILATYADQSLKLKDWRAYFEQLQKNRNKIGEDDLLFYFNQFLQQKLQNHYRNNLQQYDEDYERQIRTFKESVMLFELMQKNIWDKNDSASLHAYYQQHQSDFKWKPYANVWILSSLTQDNISSIINKIQSVDQLKKMQSNNIYYIYSGKEELATLKLPEPQAGKVYHNNEEGLQTVTGIESLQPGGEIKTYQEAMIDVTNAYQKTLETEWLASLKKKYPVKINKKVYKKL